MSTLNFLCINAAAFNHFGDNIYNLRFSVHTCPHPWNKRLHTVTETNLKFCFHAFWEHDALQRSPQ